MRFCQGAGYQPAEIRSKRENDAAISLLKNPPIVLGGQKAPDSKWIWPSDQTAFFKKNKRVDGIYENMEETSGGSKAAVGKGCLLMQSNGRWLRDACGSNGASQILCEGHVLYVRPAI